jgi:hypothetical protein
MSRIMYGAYEYKALEHANILFANRESAGIIQQINTQDDKYIFFLSSIIF